MQTICTVDGKCACQYIVNKELGISTSEPNRGHRDYLQPNHSLGWFTLIFFLNAAYVVEETTEANFV